MRCSPLFVTADEIANPTTSPSPSPQRGVLSRPPDTKDLIYDIGRLIEFASRSKRSIRAMCTTPARRKA